MKPAPAILACLLLLTAGCGDDTGDNSMRTAPVDVREELRSRRTDPQIVVEGNTAFALDLYHEGYSFRDAFLAVTGDSYGAELARTVFPEPGRTEINTWTADRTAGKIRELLREGVVDGETVLVLVSAIYFKGEWLHPFPEDQTEPADFYVTPTKTVKVPMMYTEDAFFPYGETDDVQILELPYRAAGRDGECSMVILLPKAKDGLPKLEASLTVERLRQLLPLPARRGKFPVYLPKFSFSSPFFTKCG